MPIFKCLLIRLTVYNYGTDRQIRCGGGDREKKT